jgi:2-polyprenyl-6-methoxyphenol hydroxylase-like FAD-dependent oxidoreductase
MNFDLTWDLASQAVPPEIVQFQPNYGEYELQLTIHIVYLMEFIQERELRAVVSSLPTCELRAGCEVVGRTEEDGYTVVEYLDEKGVSKLVKTSWLVGADGKRGIVRKKFLEPEGIKQELGL